MIVMFHSPVTGQGCKSAAAVMACALSGKFNKKTLILQLTNPRQESMENIMFKKELDATTIKALEYEFDDAGIDALMRRASSSSLEKNHFSDVAVNLHERTNMLDIIGITKKEEFERETEASLSNVKSLLDQANKLYDIVLVLCPNTKSNLTQKLLEFCDVSVICVPQSPRYFSQSVPKTLEKQITQLLVVTDYEPESKYTLRNIAHGFGIKTNMVSAIMHDPKFKDAYANGSIFNFIMRNLNDDPDDDIYCFMRYVIESAGKIIANENRYNTRSRPDAHMYSKKEEPQMPQLKESNGFVSLGETPVAHTADMVKPMLEKKMDEKKKTPVTSAVSEPIESTPAPEKKKAVKSSSVSKASKEADKTQEAKPVAVKTTAKKSSATSAKTTEKKSEEQKPAEKATTAVKKTPVKTTATSKQKSTAKADTKQETTDKQAASKSAKTAAEKTPVKKAASKVCDSKSADLSQKEYSAKSRKPAVKGKE